MRKAGFTSPVGPLTLWQDGGALTRLDWSDAGGAPDTPLLSAAVDELDRYFRGALENFSVPCRPQGASPFQEKFFAALCAIPYGETRTYGDLANELGAPAQAIGQACGANPLAIFIPCHRVLGAQGLGGYSGAGGIETKVALLKLEGAAGLLI